MFSSGDVIVAFGPITLEFWMVESCVDDAQYPRTSGKMKFCSIFIGHSHDPLPIIESKMHLISPDNAKLNKHPILPPFTDFGKYDRNKIGTLIVSAHAEFVRNGIKIQFKTETLSAARKWILETPDPTTHRCVSEVALDYL